MALDPGREVNVAFRVEGIPKSFLFDREGRLAAQTIDMRTESHFVELLKMAGLELAYRPPISMPSFLSSSE